MIRKSAGVIYAVGSISRFDVNKIYVSWVKTVFSCIYIFLYVLILQEVCVIRYEASSDDEKLSYVSLYSYFYSRKRCGVVSNCYTCVKDMYLVPLASHQPIPPELLPFDGPGKITPAESKQI